MKRIVINDEEVFANNFAYDGCHKIYLLENSEEEETAKKAGYNIHPVELLEKKYRQSCGLEFINTWNLKSIIHQLEPLEKIEIYEQGYRLVNVEDYENAFRSDLLDEVVLYKLIDYKKALKLNNEQLVKILVDSKKIERYGDL